MTNDALIHAYDVALLQGASRFDLTDRVGRKASAAWLADLFMSLVTKAIKPELALELGAYSARFSRRVSIDLPQAQAHAFEANRYNYEQFRTKVEKSGASYHHLAVGDESKMCVLKIVRTRDGQPVSPT